MAGECQQMRIGEPSIAAGVSAKTISWCSFYIGES
jgi:hypothetical protein